MCAYQFFQLVFLSLVIITVKSHKGTCRECDLALMYKDWVPCAALTGKCQEGSQFSVRVTGDVGDFCPTGCRCYSKTAKHAPHGTETANTVERKPENTSDTRNMDGASAGFAQFKLSSWTLSAVLEQMSLCDVFTEAQNMTYNLLYGRRPPCDQLDSRVIYATLERPDKLGPRHECRMPPFNGRKLAVSSDEDKNALLRLMRGWQIRRAWVLRDEEVRHERKLSPCDSHEKCAWNFRCGECCTVFDTTSQSGSWLRVPCDELYPFICVHTVSGNLTMQLTETQ